MSRPSMDEPEIPLRIVIEDPVPGVTLRVQKGRGELVEPTSSSASEVVFDFTVRVGARPGGRPNFLGPFTQGPPDGRFVYINVGQNAGQHDSPWSRRAKIPLMEISAAQVREVADRPGARLEVRFQGRGRDGTPVCATVRLPENAWQVKKGGRK